MPYLLASYPRSGSTWLRFILCNLYYPQWDHDFVSVDRYIPYWNSEELLRDSIPFPHFYKTHDLHQSQNVIFLHRHVGDVLISEWWYKKRHFNENRSLEDYLEADEWGRGWREFIMYYFPCSRFISYEHLGCLECIRAILPEPGRFHGEDIDRAIRLSSFKRLQKVEMNIGVGGNTPVDSSIPFIREGKTGQWREWPWKRQDKLITENYVPLRLLGYL